MRDDPQGTYRRVKGTFFFDSRSRMRVWSQYLTDNFQPNQVSLIKSTAAGFSSKSGARKKDRKIESEDINLSIESGEETPELLPILNPTQTPVELLHSDASATDPTTQAETPERAPPKRFPFIPGRKGSKKFGEVAVPLYIENLVNPKGGISPGTLPFNRYTSQPEKNRWR